MSDIDFGDVFRAATGLPSPYAYQCRLACGEGADPNDPQTLCEVADCKSRLIDIPTGLGKTAAVVLAWLWNRVLHPNQEQRHAWPRRLVYCLPMRTLVEQTRDNVHAWLEQLRDKYGQADAEEGELAWLAKHSPVVLMGGEDRTDWDLYPERPAIIIGTQDMLLSRALNRGYGMSRYRWPMHFGLLNNDCLWVMDETQLMGPGLVTTTQLDGFRFLLWGVEKPCVSWWMSATASRAVFSTTDRQELGVPAPSVFPEAQEIFRDVQERLRAKKDVALLPTRPKTTGKDGSAILNQHSPGRITLVIANTVDSARLFHDEIQTQLAKASSNKKKKDSTPQPRLLLLHSRFRARDRQKVLDELEAFRKQQRSDGSPVPGYPGIILFSTQVIEAGYDLSAAKLWSEIAPWSSVIQRLGRLNREGKQPEAKAFFWKPKRDVIENGKDSPNARRTGPYEDADLDQAAKLIEQLVSRLRGGEAYRSGLDAVLATDESARALEVIAEAVIRPDDLNGLFSTEPDLAGGFTNVAPYIRDDDRNVDVTVFWREFKGHPAADLPSPSRDETVAVPFYEVQRFLSTGKEIAYLWDEETERWSKLPPRELVAGMTILLPTSAGGYSETRGWTGKPDDKPKPLQSASPPPPTLGSEQESETGWQSLSQHTSAVENATRHLLTVLDLDNVRAVFDTAARWHDVGKAHSRWQRPLREHAPHDVPAPWGKFSGIKRFRPGFRHEALSLLVAWTKSYTDADNFTALTLYLIASHHGKVRTVLRSTGDGDNLFGLREDDEPLGSPSGSEAPFVIDLNWKEFAGHGSFSADNKTFTPLRPSWTAIVGELLGPAWRDDLVTTNAVPADELRKLGPFRLAYLEAVFRAADGRASKGDFGPVEP